MRAARRAEEVGFTFAMISDHYQPWTDRQGQARPSVRSARRPHGRAPAPPSPARLSATTRRWSPRWPRPPRRCCAGASSSEAAAQGTALEIWPTAAPHGEVSQQLPVPRHFAEATKGVTADQVARMVVCGPDQEGFFDFYRREILPRVR
ncbi:MAG TPA: hypothetical protein VFW96_25340 [Thermomicrobiales bacterium]|nr:hypothetical protein [Thermomicrobiales bacterium]